MEVDDYRARCKKHPLWRGPWRSFRKLLELDLRLHMLKAHPKIKHPEKVARVVAKRGEYSESEGYALR